MIDFISHLTLNIFKCRQAHHQYILSEIIMEQTRLKSPLTNKIFCILLLLFIAVQNAPPLGKSFCHSDCIDYTGACFDVTPLSCYACADNIYKNKDFTNPYNPCQLKDQRRIMFKELESSNSLSLDGFSTSNPNVYTCNNISFSGKYTNLDYLQRNFTEINAEHFELIVRFNVGYIGSWAATDNLQLEIHDGVMTSYHFWEYTCGKRDVGSGGTIDETQNLCSVQGTDCVKIIQFTIQHNSSYVYLKWTALTTQNNPNVQNWGIKDLLIVAKTCHRYCDKCFGENVTQCLTCSPGYFLRGNTCVQKCPKLSILLTQMCVDLCPMKYYHNVLNNRCEPCLDGCSLCSGLSHCLLWDNIQVDLSNDLQNNKTELLIMMIIIIIMGVALIGLVVWKFIFKKYPNSDKKQIISDGQTPKIQKLKTPESPKSSDKNPDGLKQFTARNNNFLNPLWITDIDSFNLQTIDPVKVDVRRRKKRKADFEQTLNNSEVNF